MPIIKMTDIPDDNDVKFFIDTLKKFSCYDLSGYSPNSLKNRLNKVLRTYKINLLQLSDKIIKDKIFADNIIKIITVNTTELFRDTKLWINLQNTVLPFYKNNNSVKIWHAGCSTGLEVFSMLILLDKLNLFEKCEIYATDINADSLEIAKKGVYKYLSNKIFLDNFEKVINPESISMQKKKISYNKYFTIDMAADELRMSSTLLNKPVYKLSNIIKERNPFDLHYDIIVCRNVIIYFNTSMQKKMIHLFYNNLLPDGCLILGMHERIQGSCSNYFEKKQQVYFKKS